MFVYSSLLFFTCLNIFFANGLALGSEKSFEYPGSIDPDSIKVLDLQTAREIAIEGNPSLAAAEERVRQAIQRLAQAKSSYWPQLSLTGSGTRSIMSENDHNSSLINISTGSMDDRTDTYRSSLNATWTLFNGFEREFSAISARYGADESKQAKNEALRRLLSSISASYYNAQLARESITIAEANEAYNERLLKEAEARYRVGTGSLSDVLNFKVQINSAKADLIQAEQEYEIALYGLAALMGMPDSKFPSHMELESLESETQDELISPDSESLIQYALEHRPDMLQNDYQLKQMEANVGSARAGFYPTISLSGSIEGDKTGSAEFEREDYGKTIGLNLTYKLFAGGYNRAKVRETESGLKEAQRNLESSRISVKSEVESAIAALRSAQEQLLLQRSNADLVLQTRDLVEKEYAAGQVSLVRLNEAQKDLVTAQSRLALSLVSMRQAWENLKASTAQILESSAN